MKLNEVIEYNLKKFKELGLDNPLQEIRYIILEKIGISLEDQILKRELVIKFFGCDYFINLISILF